MIAIYIRVSTEEQLKGYSIDGQISDCLQLADTQDVYQYIDDGYTGEILNRPSLMNLLEDVEKGLIKKVICYDPDRLSRKLLNQLIITEQLEKNNVALQFVQSDYKNDAEGQLNFQIRGAFSEFDKAKIKHNTMTGRYRKAKQGFVVKDGGLFGYDYDRENHTYIINEQEAKVVQLIFDYYTEPLYGFKGINGIAHHLTKMGIPTAKGKSVWHRQVVRQMLLNKSYTGVYYQNKYDTEGDYVKRQAGKTYRTGRLRPKEEWIQTKIPLIISINQFNRAQTLLKQARRRYAGYKNHTYLLSGLVRCGRCGETMSGRNSKSRGKNYYVYLCRKNYAGTNSKGCGRMMSENKLNYFVWRSVCELLNDQTKINNYNDPPSNHNKYNEKKMIENQIKRIEKGKERLLILASVSEEDGMDIKEIKEKLKDLQHKEQQLKQKLKAIHKNKILESNYNNKSAMLGNVIKYYLEHKQSNFKIEEKQKLLRVILQEVRVYNATSIQIHTF